MSYLLASGTLIIILLAGFIFTVWSVVEFIKDWSVVSKAWQQMDTFEKRLLYMGLSLFVFIPALKHHPAADWYIAKVIIEMLPVLAGGFFVTGVLGFMRQVHKVRLSSNA